MKTMRTLLVCLAVAVAAVACNPSIQEEAEVTPSNPVLDRIAELGFDVEGAVELDKYWLVEGDILFGKTLEELPTAETIEKWKAQGERLEQAYTNNRVGSHYMNMWVQCSVSSWYSATRSAMNDWTNISNCRVKLHYDSYEDIWVKADGGSLPNTTIAAAGFPANGRPYHEILINTDFYNNYNVSESQKRYNMVHEIGHCLGLRHTNWASRGESAGSIGATTVPGTSGSDAGSVMNGGTALNSWNGFSNGDLTAARHLYPDVNCNPSSYYSNWLISPNGGQEWIEKSTYTIRWDVSKYSGSQVRLQLLYHDEVYQWDNKYSLNTLVPNTGSYSWRISGVYHDNEDDFKIKFLPLGLLVTLLTPVTATSA